MCNWPGGVNQMYNYGVRNAPATTPHLQRRNEPANSAAPGLLKREAARVESQRPLMPAWLRKKRSRYRRIG